MNLFQISGFLAVILFSFSDLTGSQLNFNRREKVRKGSYSLGSVREEDASLFGGTSGPRSGLCARTGRLQTLQAGGDTGQDWAGAPGSGTGSSSLLLLWSPRDFGIPKTKSKWFCIWFAAGTEFM